MRTMSGSTVFPFSEMVQDTIRTHGYLWALEYYCCQNDLSVFEFNIFAGLSTSI